MENLLTVFIVVTALAVLLQAGILLGMYVAMRKSSARMEALATEVKSKVLPAAETAQTILVELRPKLESILSNVQDTTKMVRGQMERLDATANDVVDRTRLQVIRADELLTRTMDRVEETTEMVHKTVISPVRQLSGLMQALTVGLEALLGAKRRRRDRDTVGVPQDEMFI
jgi:chromatin segregation and condensation protein Rec8/ScpA/Scc1 (kleisin family)